jgi:hypothetical protein
MKSSIKSIIFAVALGSFTTASNIAFANDHDSVSNNTLLVRGAENKFADFMNQKAKKFVKKEDWGIFEQVVTLYNVAPSKLLIVNTETKVAFNEAVKNLDRKLEKMNADEAKVWRKKVQVTANVINFLWNNKFNAEQIETQLLDYQVVTVEAIGE